MSLIKNVKFHNIYFYFNIGRPGQYFHHWSSPQIETNADEAKCRQSSRQQGFLEHRRKKRRNSMSVEIDRDPLIYHIRLIQFNKLFKEKRNMERSNDPQ